MRTTFLLCIALVALTGCGGGGLIDVNPSDDVHTVKEYYEDDALTARTVEACRAKNEADLRAKKKKPACVNAWKANNAKTWNEPLPAE